MVNLNTRYRCCVYRHNITGRFSAQCIPLRENQTGTCTQRPNQTIVIGHTSNNPNECRFCREAARMANDMLT